MGLGLGSGLMVPGRGFRLLQQSVVATHRHFHLIVQPKSCSKGLINQLRSGLQAL